MIFEKQTDKVGKYYVYTHVRMDKGVVFYVGIGTKYRHEKDYSRAKAKSSQRNCMWKSIVLKTEYKILIVFEDDDYNKVKDKEIELIAKYGRICDAAGSLCNLTGGGDGAVGYRNKNIMKPVYLYLSSGEFFKDFESYADCGRFLKTAATVVGQLIDKDMLIKNYIAKSYKSAYVDPVLNIKEKLKKRLSKPVYQYDLDNKFIKKWPSSSEAARVLKINGSHIREMALGSNLRKRVGNFIWKY